jgi:epoxide hydrolase 4
MDLPAVRFERVTGQGGVSLNVARAGAGPPVVLLHGFPESWVVWRRQMAALFEAGFGVHAAELRGYGASDRPPGRKAYRLARLVEDMAALVLATRADRAHVVGHDWGGVIAWAFAERYPELLDRLVILNAPHPRSYLRRVWRPSQLARSWYVLFFQLPWLPERVLSANDFAAIRRMYRRLPSGRIAFSEQDIDDILEALRPPGALTAALNYYRANVTSLARASAAKRPIKAETLVVWGERDPSLSTVLLERISTVAPNVRVARFPEFGHWIQNEAPDEVNRLMVEFLRG